MPPSNMYPESGHRWLVLIAAAAQRSMPSWRRTVMLCALVASAAAVSASAIDREAVVRRHAVRLRGIGQTDDAPAVLHGQPLSLTVGNGAMGFNADATGMQSLNGTHKTFPLSTLSDWGWHSSPPPGIPAGAGHQDEVTEFFRGYKYDLYNISDGRQVPYPTAQAPTFTPGQANGSNPYEWLRRNPHRLDLIQVALRRQAAPDVPLTPADLDSASATQELCPWTGELASNFSFGTARAAVRTKTACHMDLDLLSWRVESPALLGAVAAGHGDGPTPAPDARADALAVRVAFPYGSGDMGGGGHDWTKDAAHTTSIVRSTATSVLLKRQLDFDQYLVLCKWSAGATFKRDGPHAFLLEPHQQATGEEVEGAERGGGAGALELSCLLSPPDARYPIDPVRKRLFVPFPNVKTINLPRQAQGKHKETLKHHDVSTGECVARRQERSHQAAARWNHRASPLRWCGGQCSGWLARILGERSLRGPRRLPLLVQWQRQRQLWGVC